MYAILVASRVGRIVDSRLQYDQLCIAYQNLQDQLQKEAELKTLNTKQKNKKEEQTTVKFLDAFSNRSIQYTAFGAEIEYVEKKNKK